MFWATNLYGIGGDKILSGEREHTIKESVINRRMDFSGLKHAAKHSEHSLQSPLLRSDQWPWR